PVMEDTGKHRVIVTILPQAEFVERVGGDSVAVTVMVPPGASLHTYELIPGQMMDVSKANMYAKVGSGIEFELVWMSKITAQNKNMLIVDCSKGVDLIEMNSEHHVHEDETHNNYSHVADPHIWMSPLNAKIMVSNICDGLIQIDLENRSFYEMNRDDYLSEITEVDENIRETLLNVTNRKFAVFHPALGYFAKEYDLTMFPIEEGGKEPTAESIVVLIDQMKRENIKIIFASPQFNPESAEVIAREISGEVVFIDPVAKDYIKNLNSIANEFVKAMR
ncbi:metal ABC transporter solute-binding protein, Zn/Mn family, partial [Chloroflexota bacterium]